MIEAQQQRMGDADFWDLQPQLLRIDEPSVRVRRKLAQMIQAEAEHDQTYEQVEQLAGATER